MEQNDAWAVVYVWRGIPDQIELFAGERLAREREQELRHDLPMEDAIGVFEVRLPSKVAP